MTKRFGTMMMLILILGLFYTAVGSYLNTPIVVKSTRHDRVVACVTPDHGEQQASTAICQEVLKRGKFEVEWTR